MDETLKQQVDNIERKLDEFLSEYYRNNNPTSQTFTKKLYFKGGIDLSTITTMIIGATTSTLGFFGHTAVAQQSAVTSPSGGGTSSTDAIDISSRTAIGQIKTALTNLGLTL